MEINLRPTLKQHEAYEAMRDEIVKYVILGGGAGGGKSWFGCEWLTLLSLQYPGVKSFVGREHLKKIMGSTFITFQKVFKHHGLELNKHWKFNGQYSYIEFYNGSRIDFLDLKLNPSDPLYERYGSSEYTVGWLEEAGEIEFKAFDVLKSRINRHMNKDYNVLPKMLITCNPKKNWLYTLIYRPFKALALEPKYKFIVSLYSDNPYTADTYGESLAELHDNAMKQRLMYGNWEYDDDPAILMPYDSICAVFSNRLPESKERYITCDIARFGRDKTVIFRWEGFEVVEIIVHASNSLDSLAEELRNMAEKHRIPRSCIVVDESGVGGGVMDILRCKGFISNNAPIQPEAVKFDKSKKKNYKSLKDQCAFMLTEKVNNFELAICSTKWEEEIKEELDQIRQADMDREAPLRIVSKDDVKKNIGRSPDFSDALLMRLYFELHSKPKTEGVDYNTAANQYMAGASGLDPIALDFVSRTGQQVIQN